jgi:signal transduction histidine kinase
MDISEAKTGILHLDIKRVDMTTLIEGIVELYRYIAEEKDVAIQSALASDLTLCGDPDRLRQALGNLLDNAVKYTREGGHVYIEAHRRETQMIIVVKDTGIGITSEDLPKIWDRLYRGDESRSQKGMGIGLSFVKPIVEIHGGHVEVSSNPGVGSTFTVYLPLSV